MGDLPWSQLKIRIMTIKSIGNDDGTSYCYVEEEIYIFPCSIFIPVGRYSILSNSQKGDSMRKGDKVIFRSNTPRILWGVDINFLLGNICIIKSIIELTSKTFERKAYD